MEGRRGSQTTTHSEKPLDDIISCRRRTGVDAVMALLTDTPNDNILVVGDPSLADEIRRSFGHKNVVCANRPRPGWTVVMAEYGPPTFWERLTGRAA